MIEHGTAGREQLRLLREAGISFVTGVPDSVFKELIATLEEEELDRFYVLAAREDTAVALAVGAHLAGEQPLVFMESSGMGNAVDALTSLAMVCRAPLVLFIGWAGYRGRDVPHHNVIGEPLPALLQALGVPAIEVGMDDLSESGLGRAFAMAVEQARASSGPVAILGVPPGLREGAG
jgi:sulfopyruvate decarboxylase TPP-binding subunit